MPQYNSAFGVVHFVIKSMSFEEQCEYDQDGGIYSAWQHMTCLWNSMQEAEGDSTLRAAYSAEINAIQRRWSLQY